MSQPRRRSRATTPAPAGTTTHAVRCTCRTGPVLIGTYRNQDLVQLERRHWQRDHCEMPAQPVDITTWSRQ